MIMAQHTDEQQKRTGVRRTAFLLVLLAAGFYAGFILFNWAL
ncbi:MAG: hypothetical protein BMS9Abin15_0560 [Gammaproteobacteria bacterium]|nr:MAG: hypothetical protein BMS9Abin15_0560 [Gammaproteobacteria bacterium]